MSLIDIDQNLRGLVEKSRQVEGPLEGTVEALIKETRLLESLGLGSDTDGSKFFLRTMRDLSVIVQSMVYEEFGSLNWRDARPYGMIRRLSVLPCEYRDESGKKLNLFRAVRKNLSDYGISGNVASNVMDGLLTEGIITCELRARRPSMNGSKQKQHGSDADARWMPSSSFRLGASKRLSKDSL